MRLSALPPPKIISVQVVKSPAQTTCSHLLALGWAVPKMGKGRPGREVTLSGLSRGPPRPSSPAAVGERKRAASEETGMGQRIRAREAGSVVPEHRLGQEEWRRGGEAARCPRAGRAVRPRGPTPPRTRDPPSPRTRRAFRVRRLSPEEEPLPHTSGFEKSGNFAREMLPTLQHAEKEKYVRR